MPAFFHKCKDMLFQNIKKVADDIVKGANKAMYKALDDNLSTMADANREQLTFGIDSTGNEIKPLYRSEPYARLKKALGSRSPFGTPDLKLSGAFHSGIFSKRNNKTIVFGGRDSKTGDLTSKYGDNILGLTEENRNNITYNQIIPDLFGWYSAQIKRLKQ